MTWKSLLPTTFNPLDAIQMLEQDGNLLQGLTNVFILLILYLGAVFLVVALGHTVWSFLQTIRYFTLLPKAGERNEFAAKHREWQEKNGPLADDFGDYLIEVPKGNGTMDTILKRCASASEIFNEDTLAHGIIGNRFYLAMPAMLTGLGVLGTFVGLAMGIGNADLDLEGKAPEELGSSIIPLIQGSATAFLTSVWGVGASLAFALCEKGFEWFARLPIRSLQKKLNSLVPLYTPESSMVDLQRSSLENEATLKGLAVAIGDQMQQALDRIGESVTDAVRDALGGQAKDLGEMSANLMSEALTEELGKLQQSMTGMAEGFRSEFTGANQQLQSTVSGFDNVIRSLEGTVLSTQSSVEQSVERLESQSEIVASMEEAAGRIAAAAEGFQSMRETLHESAEKNVRAATAQERSALINKEVAEQFEAVSEHLPEFRETMEQAGSSIRVGAEAARDTYSSLVDHQRIWFEGVEIGLNTMKSRLDELIKAYGDDVEGQTQELMDRWTQEVQKSLQNFAVQTEALEGAIADLTDSENHR